ncbi:MAG TPA: class II glutamine amidotransferase [Burkholderiales bacterium]|nr:class II glutamine amidotransferase [Burkholderiales bacterium]
MCRALLYLGKPVLLDNLLFQPDSALVRQSYMPKMLNLLNLAGFGLRAWDPASHRPEQPFFYGSSSLPVFDRNLKNLAEKVRAGCVLAHVRGVAYSTAVDISLQNVHPFQFEGLPWALAHNGDLAGMHDMKRLLAPHVKREFLPRIRGTTDSEWVYALFVSQLSDPAGPASEEQVFSALEATLGIIRRAREALGIAHSSSVNLFIANGEQLAALRYCFDFGCYRTDDPGKVHEANLTFLSLWYTLGRDYGLHEGEWKMTGGAEHADSILVASEPLTRDTSSWVELPEYGALFAELGAGRPRVSVRLLD